jgi:ATP-dependent exoDNAse (exonuclease V) beta subunit
MAMLDVFLKQKSTKIIVGDSHQQIYGWRFAINSLEKVNYNSYPLSQSFRFDDEVAFLANTILKWKKSYFKQEAIPIKGITVNKEFLSTATIARSNVVLLDSAIQYIQKNPADAIYFEGNIQSYTYAEETGTSVYDVLNLSIGKHNLIKGKLVRRMSDIEELIQYVEKTEDASTGMIIEMVGKYGNDLPGFINELKQKHTHDSKRHEANMIFSTVHRCKGMEYDTVFLCDDFFTEKAIQDLLKDEEITERKKQQLAEEINILYVACTRTKSKLHIPTNINPFDTLQWEFPGDKVDKRDLVARARNISSMEELKKMLVEFGLNDNKPANHGKKWDKEELKILSGLFKGGKTKNEIASCLQRTTASIEMKLNSLGMDFRK